MTISKKWLGFTRVWPIYPAVLFLLLLFVYPTALLVGLSAVDVDGNITVSHYSRLFDQGLYTKVLLITLKVAAWTTGFAIIAGYPVAYLLANVRSSLRNTLIIWVLLPFWTSFLVRTFAWMVLLGRKGAINDLLIAVGILDYPIKIIYNFTGVMIGMVHALMPLCVLTMLAVMENIDTNLTKAAGTMGARRGQSFWRIYFPLSLSGVAAGGLLIFVTSLGFFITPALLGGAKDTMIVQLIMFQIDSMLNWGFAGAISMLLLGTVLLIFFFYDRWLGLSTLSGGTQGKVTSSNTNRRVGLGARFGNGILNGLGEICAGLGAFYDKLVKRDPARSRADYSRRSLWVVAGIVIFFLAAPTFFIIPVSFTEEGFAVSDCRSICWFFRNVNWSSCCIYTGAETVCWEKRNFCFPGFPDHYASYYSCSFAFLSVCTLALDRYVSRTHTGPYGDHNALCHCYSHGCDKKL
jgi:putative spermidine/putrescine transport system permease protein